MNHFSTKCHVEMLPLVDCGKIIKSTLPVPLIAEIELQTSQFMFAPCSAGQSTHRRCCVKSVRCSHKNPECPCLGDLSSRVGGGLERDKVTQISPSEGQCLFSCVTEEREKVRFRGLRRLTSLNETGACVCW